MPDDDVSRPTPHPPGSDGDEVQIVLHIKGAFLRIDHPPSLPADLIKSYLARAADFFDHRMIAAQVIAMLDQRQKEREHLSRLGLR